MNRALLVLFAVFASTILLTQVISSADAAYSEERKKAKEREKQLVDAQEKKEKDKTKKALDAEKKALDAVVSIKAKEPKGKSSTDSTNAARLKVINDAKAAYDVAKTALDAAEKAYKADKTDATKKQAYLDAKKTFEKAKIDRQLAKLG